MKKLLFFSAFAVIIAISGCKKNDGYLPANGVFGAELTGKDWRPTASKVTISGGGMDTTINTYVTLDACEKDNLIRFNDDKTVTKKYGAIKCNPSEPDTEYLADWELLDGDTKLKLTKGTESGIVNISTLNATTLSFSHEEIDNGVTLKVIITYTRN